MNRNEAGTWRFAVVNAMTLLIFLSTFLWIFLAVASWNEAAKPFNYNSYENSLSNQSMFVAMAFCFGIAAFVALWATVWASETDIWSLWDLCGSAIVAPLIVMVGMFFSMIAGGVFGSGGTTAIATAYCLVLVIYGAFCIVRFLMWLADEISYRRENNRLKSGEMRATLGYQKVYLTAPMVEALVKANLIEAELPATLGKQQVKLTTQMVVVLVEGGHLKVGVTA